MSTGVETDGQLRGRRIVLNGSQVRLSDCPSVAVHSQGRSR